MSDPIVPVLELADLAVSYREGDTWHRVVHDVSLSIKSGEVVALVGESGSGKTTTAQAVIGLLAENGRIDHGSIRLNGVDYQVSRPELADRAQAAAVVRSAFNPVMRAGFRMLGIRQFLLLTLD